MWYRSVSRSTPRAAFAVAVVLLPVGPGPARAEFIVNGGFELPALGGAPFTAPIGVGSPAIPGWEVVAGNVEVVSAAFSAPFEGDQWLDLSGLVPGTVQQTFATTPGERYQLSFAYANNPNSLFASARADVLGQGGGVLLTQTVTATGSTFVAMNYTVFEGGFVANSATTVLRFTSTGSTFANSGLALDAVSVRGVAVPEPAGAALFGTGVCAVLARTRGRRGRAGPG